MILMPARFKRLVSLAVAAAALCTMCVTAGAASGGVAVRLDGSGLALEGAYVDANNRTQVPVSLGEALGLTVQQSGDAVTFSKGEQSITFQAGERQAGDITMDTVPAKGFVPLAYLAQYFGYRLSWNGADRAAELKSPLTLSDVQSIQAYTDMTFYGQGLTAVEIVYRDGVDLEGVTPSTYVLEDRGTLSPDFGPVPVERVSVAGQTVTLTIRQDTAATAANRLVYTGEGAKGSRVRNAYGIYCTGAWYRGVDGNIYYGKQDTADFRANTAGQGYQARATLELKLHHVGEPAAAAACLANDQGAYNAGGLWRQTVDHNFGNRGFQTFEQAGIQVPSTSANAADGSGDPYVKGWVYIPDTYTGSQAVPVVFTIQGHGISYWKLPDGTNNFGTGVMYDASATSWMDKGAIVVNIHDRSSIGLGGEQYDYVTDDVRVMKYFLDHYNVDPDRIILHGNSRSTLAASTIIQALAGQPYTTNQINTEWGSAPRDHQLDKSVYDFTIGVFLCNNGTLGGEGLWKQADRDAVAKTGLRVWCFDGEQDFNNIDTAADLAQSYRAAGFDEAWIAENLRVSAFPSEMFYYWGESDHSTTRVNYWYFADAPYFGPDFRIEEGELVYNQKLQPGDTYTLQARGASRSGTKAGHAYTVYGEAFQDWALAPQA